MVFQDISLPSRSTETCYSMPQHLVSQLTGLSCTEENEFGLNNTSTYLASWTLGLRAALPHTGAYDNCLPSAPPVHVSPSTFPRLPSSSPILPPSVPLLSQDPERIAGPPAHAQLLPAGPRVGSSSSEPGIGPNGFSALSPCRPLATAWGRGLWLWKCKDQLSGVCAAPRTEPLAVAPSFTWWSREKGASVLSKLLSPPSVFLPQHGEVAEQTRTDVAFNLRVLQGGGEEDRGLH
ncbi:uncharacterized protein [Vicugna pacos]|uniref:Uncharacterized protein n=1 Tax=Vicugna pacos TaxID=30538 RepID=A0ABM5CZL8_VICPA